ncbi:MAG TPA: histidine kinase [Propionicimonas sp.]|nr:histidine kinase [Propionicimonas sp.]HQA78754.1 histidine kinase [Propionicimonas sp.]HQD97641.1 histidine kinase [Propionicimonas sp.]
MASPTRTGSLLQSAVRRGYLEPVLVGLLAVFVIASHLLVTMHAGALLYDLTALAAAALTGRWPRAAGIAFAAVMAANLLFIDWPTVSVYAALLVLFCFGVRGRQRERLWFTGLYLPLLWLLNWLGLPPGVSVVPYLFIWIVFVAVAWLAGSAWHGLIVAAEESRLRAALEERHELARELHDSVANSLAAVSLRAEQARLKGHADDAELSAIADEAARAVGEFGQIVQVLRRDSGEPEPSTGSVSLEGIIDNAVQRLRSRGFAPNLSWDGPRPSLPVKAAHTLARVIEEATNNMLRYGDPGADSAIVVEVSPGTAEFAFINRPKNARGAGGSGFGLTSMSERVSALGGSFTSSQVGESWLTSFQVPIAALPAAAVPS